MHRARRLRGPGPRKHLFFEYDEADLWKFPGPEGAPPRRRRGASGQERFRFC